MCCYVTEGGSLFPFFRKLLVLGMLVRQTDPNQSFALRANRTLIGRNDPSTARPDFMPLRDAWVSRQHSAIVREEDGQYFVEDLHSLNGTFVNGFRVSGSRVRLWEHDLLSFGQQDDNRTCFVFMLLSDSISLRFV